MSNYPPGVTGNEYQISGAEREWEETRECPHCGWEGPMHHEYHHQIGIWAWCANPERVEAVQTKNEETGETFYGTAPCPLTREGFEVEMPEGEEGLFHP